MKKIPEPDLGGATILTPAELNRIHFAGNHTPLSPANISELANEKNDRIKGKNNTATDK